MSQTTIDLLRHGEPVGGRAYRGAGIDDPLSEQGWAQMWAAVGGSEQGGDDEPCPWTRIVSSPLARCRDFAEALGARHGLPVGVEPRLREVGFGSWEGRTPAEVQRESAEEYAAFYRDPVHNRPPGAEPLAAFVDRIVAAFEQTLRAHAGEHLLLVVHAGVIRAVVAHVLAADLARAYRVAVDNACFTRVIDGERGRVLAFHNRPRL